MKQVKYFDVYSKGKITKYCVSNTKEYRDMVRILKYSDKDLIVTYIEFDDGTSGITDDWCNSLNIKINDATINRTKQATEKALADFKKLLAPEKLKECVRYGNNISSTDMNTTDGRLSFKIFEIYGAKFIFILISGKVANYYELQ